MNQIIRTDDGSNTLYSEEFKEHYHSTFGAINESKHVFIKEGLNYCNLKSIKIFEVGFGTGLNVLLSYIESALKNIQIDYTAIELYPMNINIISKLNYTEQLGRKEKDLFKEIHNCKWEEKKILNENFKFCKYQADFNKYHFLDKFDLVYFDAFSPDTQPELWSKNNFKKIYNALNYNGILTTYSSKGMVKNNLRESGFNIKRLIGPPGKRHILRAEKNKTI